MVYQKKMEDKMGYLYPKVHHLIIPPVLMVKSLKAEMHAMLSQALERCESLKMEAADAQRTAALKTYPPKKKTGYH